MGAITTGVAATATVAIAVVTTAAGYAGGAPAIERVSVGRGGSQQGNRDTMDVQVSADGRYVAFTSKASNLVPGDTNGKADVFVRDRTAGTTVQASVRPQEVDFREASQLAAISDNGRYTLFTAERRAYQLRGLLFDRQSGRTRWVTPAVGGGARGGGAVDLSADGSLVLYRHEYDMYVRDLVAGTTGPHRRFPLRRVRRRRVRRRSAHGRSGSTIPSTRTCTSGTSRTPSCGSSPWLGLAVKATASVPHRRSRATAE